MNALELADALEAQPECTCHAMCYFECGCDAIWPEQWIQHAAAELRRLHAQVEIEREACATICDVKSEHWWAKWKHQADLRDMGMADGADECAQAIRSRK